MFTDAEFEELTSTLYKLGLKDGDLGFAQWNNTIGKLTQMRNKNIALTKEVARLNWILQEKD
jgi:hypothetical protein